MDEDPSTVVSTAETERRTRTRARLRAGLISLVAAVLIFGAKLLAYLQTGSAAILSDALESIVNIVAAGMASFSVWYGSQPADENHPYGHGKIEDFSAGVEGALIVIAAGGILYSSVPRFFDPQPIERMGVGLLLVVVASAANAVLGWFLLREGGRQRSRALVADGKHVLADVVTSAGAIVALGLVAMSGRLWIDPLIACLIAGHILVSGFRLIRESVGRLMDEADDAALDQIADRLETERPPDWIDVHELRAWWSGDVLHVDVHLVLPRYWSIEQSHAEAEAITSTLERAVGSRSGVVVHVDPCSESWCRLCAVADCPVRARDQEVRTGWSRAHLVRTVAPGDTALLSEAATTRDPAPPARG